MKENVGAKVEAIGDSLKAVQFEWNVRPEVTRLRRWRLGRLSQSFDLLL